MHGAIGDIGWLQRDFSVYVVNMFDTHIAAKILEFPRGCLSLAFLLHHYCKVSTEKRFQLADWRIRPLVIISSPDMFWISMRTYRVVLFWNTKVVLSSNFIKPGHQNNVKQISTPNK